MGAGVVFPAVVFFTADFVCSPLSIPGKGRVTALGLTGELVTAVPAFFVLAVEPGLLLAGVFVADFPAGSAAGLAAVLPPVVAGEDELVFLTGLVSTLAGLLLAVLAGVGDSLLAAGFDGAFAAGLVSTLAGLLLAVLAGVSASLLASGFDGAFTVGLASALAGLLRLVVAGAGASLLTTGFVAAFAAGLVSALRVDAALAGVSGPAFGAVFVLAFGSTGRFSTRQIA